ncbi:hypothetical protein Pst134EA_005263 [Puccinia striiformis f. sp. tritici]|uniref:hypothetical protein n=1 Tax=Puccinia striiformis f. sp. tritici TaxID=168172 RepID=UPI0020085CD7|nr:hypothetical protein Pst134EA_005263 [Puccinia striiformis f. sp. tritici]KAH9471363.1 hypothetical protein Pst134EA_005263 [Puccinia striiformis f. sp. tritici]
MGSDGSPKTNSPQQTSGTASESDHESPDSSSSGPGNPTNARDTPLTHPTAMGEWGNGPPQQKSTWADRLAVPESTEKPNNAMLRSGKTQKKTPNSASQIASKKLQSVAPPKPGTTKPVSGVSQTVPSVSNGGWEKVSKKKAAKFNKPTTSDLFQNGFHQADQELEQARKSLDTGDKEALRKKAESLRDSQDDSSSNNGIIPPENDPSTKEADDEKVESGEITSKAHKPFKNKKKGNKSMVVEQDIMGNFDLLESFLAGSRPSSGEKNGKGPSEQKGEQLGKAQKPTSSKKPKGKKKGLPPMEKNQENGVNEEVTLPVEISVGSNPSLAESSVGQMFEEIFSHPERFAVQAIDQSWKKYKAPSTSKLDEPNQETRPIEFGMQEKLENLWKISNMDSRLMNHVSTLLKVDNKENHLGIEEMDFVTFQLIVSHAMEDKDLMRKIQKFLEIKLDKNEAFRRMSALSKQLVQINISQIKNELERWDQNKIVFEDSRSGEYGKTFDIFGHYGLSKIDTKFQINKEYYVQKPRPTPDMRTKYTLYVDYFGEHEAVARSPPTVHFQWQDFHRFIAHSHYERIIHTTGFIQSLHSKGLSLNRILTVAFILGLEDGEWLKTIKENVYIWYMSKVLYKVLSVTQYNHLPWHETPERKWLITHPDIPYLDNFQKLLAKLKNIKNLKKNDVPPAVYPPSHPAIPKFHPTPIYPSQKRENIVYLSFVKFISIDPEIYNVEGLPPRLLATKLESFEPELSKSF